MKKLFLVLLFFLVSAQSMESQDQRAPGSLLRVNDQEYFEMPGLNVMVFHDYYPEGHQSGVSIIQNGVRVASNGDIRLEPTPGQWQPVPKVGKRQVDLSSSTITVPLSYPDPEKDRKGFNPIIYPDLQLSYRLRVQSEGSTVRVFVDFDEPLPGEWIGKVGFNLELFPGLLFGKTYLLDDKPGIFPRQLNGPMERGSGESSEVRPLATGRKLVVAPESPSQTLAITAEKGTLELLDGRAHHNNGWFVVRTTVPAGATDGAISWTISPNVLPEWSYKPVVQVSQVGYHPRQPKLAVIECDSRATSPLDVTLERMTSTGEPEVVRRAQPEKWGAFTRYLYYTFDFSDVEQEGLYIVSYGDSRSAAFQISPDVFRHHVWQPTLEYFLPAQMCHVQVNDRYRVWHGLCHMDDALMAPPDTHHFDGYRQGPSTLTRFEGLEHVPGINIGGWHDAGDWDLRVESQMGTVQILGLAFEEFGETYDQTEVNQGTRVVELHSPDGKPDLLQQVEHGVLSVLGGYRNLGRLYRGIIAPTLRQYVLLGDGTTMTDGRVYNSDLAEDEVTSGESGRKDDRWVFTEGNPSREVQVAAGLATASRVLRGFNDELAADCIEVARALWEESGSKRVRADRKIAALSELFLTTQDATYRDQLLQLQPEIAKLRGNSLWPLGRLQGVIENEAFWNVVGERVQAYDQQLSEDLKRNPYGVSYRPRVWGAGWDIQRGGFEHYFLHKGWPEVISSDHFLNALNFVLGSHPGSNTASFVSGVGSDSVTVAYGINRADWSFIPGGSVSGTGLIRPDLPELKEWPFFWQQTEYVVGGGASHFMFLALAARDLFD